MSNEELKPPNFEDKKETENNRESLLLKKIRGLEESVGEFRVEHEKLQYDYVTGLYKREYFEEEMEKAISSLKNPESNERKEGFKNFSLLFCDLDKFKEINDTRGHNDGDVVLKKISEIIKSNVRTFDIVCRWGGDEFAVGLFGANEEEAAKIGEKIRTVVEKEMKGTGITMSIGAVAYEKGLSMESTITRADKAMYYAKQKRNNVKTYSNVLGAKKEEQEKK